jgi:hypothetical protein
MSDDLSRIMTVCATASTWEVNVPLINRYARFHESKMLKKTLKLIRENLV